MLTLARRLKHQQRSCNTALLALLGSAADCGERVVFGVQKCWFDSRIFFSVFVQSWYKSEASYTGSLRPHTAVV